MSHESPRPPRFLYFDLGMVIVTFSVERMCAQVANCAGVSEAEARRILFETGLQADYEIGRVDRAGFHQRFCQAVGRPLDCNALDQASSDIFEINVPVLPIVARLQASGLRLGLLSNTSPGHWDLCRRRFRILEGFPIHALSYQIGACKPDPAIFAAAARLAGLSPGEIFFVDDLPGHVAGAQAAGFDAVVYRGPAQLADDLRRRGLPLASY